MPIGVIVWIVMIKSLRYYIKSLSIKKCHTLMKFRISYYIVIYMISYILDWMLIITKVWIIMMEIVFFNGGFNSSSDGVCFERPARSRYQRSVPAPTYRRRARSFNWHANHSNFCPHNFVVISANSHSMTTDREHFDLC